mgnify:FL=1
MATHEMHMRIDRSVPKKRLPGFPRFISWDDADTMTTGEGQIAVQVTMEEDLISISPRWEDTYDYGVSTEADDEGNPIFSDYPQGQISGDNGVLVCDLEPGKNFILFERTGGMVRDYRNGAVVPASIVWSKAKVSGYLIVVVA